ncbi:MAG TPA: hypothetical protein VKY90_20525 [Candidatus Dormibacteraeota bacterium]|nr:hypothetical protein [Candidatus Dormibacteraeota bacterium]
MRLRVTGGTLVTPHGRRPADLVAEDGAVARCVEPSRAGAADDGIDATGGRVLLGFIDPRADNRDPGVMGKEGFAHATLAAIRGGGTTIFDMPNAVLPLGAAPLVAAGVGRIMLCRGYALDRTSREPGYETVGGARCRLHVVHLSSAHGVRVVRQAPAGVTWVEILPTVTPGEMTAGRISPERLCRTLPEGTAGLYRVPPWKGSPLFGSDRDLTVVDPEADWRIDQAWPHSRRRLSPWHGRCGRGRPRPAVLRGEVEMPVGKPRGRPVSPRRAVERAG